ncbi:oleate hydratase [Phenylobacterium aquaticum]|nr:oleate hydratase [Phenylobacterium aquaticum]
MPRREILMEVLGHLGLQAQSASLMQDAICLPCMMPFITSQFLPRRPGDRPQPIPEGYANLGLLGQFVELPDDVVFTVEYSVRSAMVAVYALLGLKRRPPEVYKGQLNPANLLKAFETLNG